jgi:hypothetical protein
VTLSELVVIRRVSVRMSKDTETETGGILIYWMIIEALCCTDGAKSWLNIRERGILSLCVDCIDAIF